MTELTEDEVAKLWNSNAGISRGWTYESVGCKEQLRLTLQDAIAKYAQPSEREIIERERTAFIAGSCWRYNKDGGGRATEVTDSERRAAMLHYPFPPIEPPPNVLTDEEVHELWGWNDDGADRALTRKIERAVLTKLAEQKP